VPDGIHLLIPASKPPFQMLEPGFRLLQRWWGKKSFIGGAYRTASAVASLLGFWQRPRYPRQARACDIDNQILEAIFAILNLMHLNYSNLACYLLSNLSYEK
jgi:hypothetical protein